MYTLPLIAQKGGMGKTALAIKRTEAAEALGLRMARPSVVAGRSRVPLRPQSGQCMIAGMRIATWCVDGINSRLKYLCHWLGSACAKKR